MISNSSTVRVRFAPSPTGYLHVGGARTAIFNWLFARKHHGEFLLRIEDTDLERSNPEMVDDILESMRWLGLESDEPVVYQSKNVEAHREAVIRLLNEDKAYRCFCSPEELQAKRDKGQRQQEEAYQYDDTCRNLPREEIEKKLAEKVPFAVRFKVDDGWVNFKDRVYKKISVNKDEIDDFIIQRQDGTPVYQLAVVVDDAAMGVTNVIRGEDHLSNTPKQILLYIALGYPVPKFAHLPLILGEDGKRLSKRHGATAVSEYKEQGYLSTAPLNYLALLGWTPKSNEEIFMPDKLVEQFDLLRVSKKSAVFDEQKLAWVSQQHFSRWDATKLNPLVKHVLDEQEVVAADEIDAGYLNQVISLLQSRTRTLYDFAEYGRFFWQPPMTFDPDAVARFWNDEAVSTLMRGWKYEIESLEDFSADTLEGALRNFADSREKKAADLIHPTRLAITGKGVSPGIFQVMALLGQEQLINRIEYALETLPK